MAQQDIHNDKGQHTACGKDQQQDHVKIRCGSFYRDMRPIDSLRQNDIPILFIHGAKDDFIPPAHSQAMAEATKGFSTVRLTEGAGHAQSILTSPEKYRGFVESFLADPAVRSR